MRHSVALLLACALGAAPAWAQQAPPPSSNADYPVPSQPEAAQPTAATGALPAAPASFATAQALADYLKAIHEAAAVNLARVAASPEAAAALGKADSSDRIAAAQDLLPQFPGAQRVRLIPAASSDTDNDNDPPCSYACLELAAAALKAEGALGEAHLFGAARSNLAYALRVGDAAKPAGTLLVQYPGTLLENTFAALKLSNSFVELRQVVGGRSMAMTQTGDKGLKQGAPTHILAAGGSLRLALWLPGGAKEEVVEPDFPWFTLGISGFVALLALLALALRLRKAVRASRTKTQAAPVEYNSEAIGGADAGNDDATIIFAGGAADVDVESILEKTGFRVTDKSAPAAAPARAPKAAPAVMEEAEHTPKDPLPALEDDATPMMPLPALADEDTHPQPEDKPASGGQKQDDDVIEFKL
jgi:hypothetical protein